MRKGFVAAVMLLTVVLVLVPLTPGFARGGGGAWHGGGGGHPSGGWHGGGDFHGHGDHGHGGASVGIFVGPGLWWGDPWWWGPAYPYYPYPDYGYPYYAAPPVADPQTQSTYIQQEPAPQQSSYWYYCPTSQTYYPYVRECPAGWLTVVPPSTAAPSGPTASPQPSP